MKYTVLLEHDDEQGGYTVTVPALPGVLTQGETVAGALAMAIIAITLHIEDLTASGEPIPTEQEPPQLHTVTVR